MRRFLLLWVAIGLLVVVSPAVGTAREGGNDVRWDLVQIVQGTVLAGGWSTSWHACRRPPRC